MFPNVRLLIVALFATIATLSCGFAVFATYGVTHQPLARLSTGTGPLQLAAIETAPSSAVTSWGTPVSSHTSPLEVDTIDATATQPAPSPDRHDETEALAPAPLPPAVIPASANAAPVAGAVPVVAPVPTAPVAAQEPAVPTPEQDMTTAAIAPSAAAPSPPTPPHDSASTVPSPNQAEVTDKPNEPAPAASAAPPAVAEPPAQRPAVPPEQQLRPEHAASTLPAPPLPAYAAEPAPAPAVAAIAPAPQTPQAVPPTPTISSAPAIVAPTAAKAPAIARHRTPARLIRRTLRATLKRRVSIKTPHRRRIRLSRLENLRNREFDNPVFASAPPPQRPPPAARVVRRRPPAYTTGTVGRLEDH